MNTNEQNFLDKEIILTDNAIKRIKAILSGENKPNHALRVSVVGGGCSGMSYNLSFDDNKGEFDKDVQAHLNAQPELTAIQTQANDLAGQLNEQGYIYEANELASGENVVFAGSGITDGLLFNGVKFEKDCTRTSSLIISTLDKSARFTNTVHINDGAQSIALS